MSLLTQWWPHLSFDKHDPIAGGEMLNPQRVSHLYWTHQSEHLVPTKQGAINQGKAADPVGLACIPFPSVNPWFKKVHPLGMS